MKIKTLLLTFALLLTYSIANAQYRALSISATNGVGLTQETTFHTLSANVHYDVNDNWYVSKWSGISYDPNNEYQRWIASDLSVNKYIGRDFSIGAGMQYRYTTVDNLSDLYLTIKINKVIKLN